MATFERMLNGGEGDDVVNGNGGDDLVRGNDGNDFWDARPDRIFGGAELSGTNRCRSARRCRRRRWPCRRCRPLGFSSIVTSADFRFG